MTITSDRPLVFDKDGNLVPDRVRPSKPLAEAENSNTRYRDPKTGMELKWDADGPPANTWVLDNSPKVYTLPNSEN